MARAFAGAGLGIVVNETGAVVREMRRVASRHLAHKGASKHPGFSRSVIVEALLGTWVDVGLDQRAEKAVLQFLPEASREARPGALSRRRQGRHVLPRRLCESVYTSPCRPSSPLSG
ncbi:hypothetical protein V5799_002653 [Amblyomma americanum]|uniref:Uncharacterized protein n=1 Tax=Amblyomma americanum TaxID=6943 RepID=A0AAQ4DB74_AMBAM